MATYVKRKNKNRTTSILTLVRIKGFKPTSKSFKTMADAKAWAEPLEEQLKEQAKRGGARADLATITLGELIAEYLDDPNTKALKSYEDLHNRLDWWSADPLLSTTKVMDIGASVLRAARAKLMNGGKYGSREPGTVNRHLSALRSAWNWAREEADLIPIERAWPVKLLTEPKGRTRFLSDEELAALLKAAERDPTVRAMILVSLATGLRQGELLKLRWKDIDLDKGTLALGLVLDKQGQPDIKNKTVRVVHVSQAAVDALTALRKGKVVSPVHPFVNASGKPLTQSFLRQRWLKIHTAAGLKDFRWHDLRHTCASILAQSGATLLEVGSVLGHKSPSMTMRYSHLTQGAAVTGHAALDAKLRGAP
jgi:integrase